MAFSKKYIGKGKQLENMDIVEVSLNLAELHDHTFQYEGETYVKFNVAKLKVHTPIKLTPCRRWKLTP